MKQREFEPSTATSAPEEMQPAEPALPRPGGVAHALLQLQQERGNRFVQEAVNQAREVAQAAPIVQTKLVLGGAGDAYEREADRIASQIISDPAAPVVGPSDVQAMSNPQGSAVEPSVQHAIQQARGDGQPLPQAVRGAMEQQLGTSLGEVKVHTDAQADQLNHALGARAFTAGKDIFFRHGSYNPATQNGAELIAHELTHVVQQGGNLGQVQAQFWEKTTSPNQPYVWHDEPVDLKLFEDAGESPRWYSENFLYGGMLGNKQYLVYQRRAKVDKAQPDSAQKKPKPPKQLQQKSAPEPTKPTKQATKAAPSVSQKAPTKPVKKEVPTPTAPPIVFEQLSFAPKVPASDKEKKAKATKTVTPALVPAVVPKPAPKPKKVKLTPEQRLPEYTNQYQALQTKLEDIQTQYLASDRGVDAQNEMRSQFWAWTTKRANLNVELTKNKERTHEYKAYQKAEQGPVGTPKPNVSFEKFDEPKETFDAAVGGTFSALVTEENKISTERAIADILAQPAPDPTDFNSVVSEYAAKEGYDRRVLFKNLAVHGQIAALPATPEDSYPQPTYNDPNAYGTEHVLQFSGRDDLSALFILHVHWSSAGRFEKAHFKKNGFDRKFKTGHAGRDDVDRLTMKVLGLIDDQGYTL